jgi:hypothetical protein
VHITKKIRTKHNKWHKIMKTQNRKMVGQNNRIKSKTKHKNNKAKKFLLGVYKLPFFLQLIKNKK